MANGKGTKRDNSYLQTPEVRAKRKAGIKRAMLRAKAEGRPWGGAARKKNAPTAPEPTAMRAVRRLERSAQTVTMTVAALAELIRTLTGGK